MNESVEAEKETISERRWKTEAIHICLNLFCRSTTRTRNAPPACESSPNTAMVIWTVSPPRRCLSLASLSHCLVALSLVFFFWWEAPLYQTVTSEQRPNARGLSDGGGRGRRRSPPAQTVRSTAVRGPSRSRGAAAMCSLAPPILRLARFSDFLKAVSLLVLKGHSSLFTRRRTINSPALNTERIN